MEGQLRYTCIVVWFLEYSVNLLRGTQLSGKHVQVSVSYQFLLTKLWKHSGVSSNNIIIWLLLHRETIYSCIDGQYKIVALTFRSVIYRDIPGMWILFWTSDFMDD